MSEPRKHHYVPQGYQKLFWEKTLRKIFELDLETGGIADSEGNNPGSRCVSPHLYRTDAKFDDYKRTHLENPILSDIDDSYPKAVMRLQFGDVQSVDRMAIASFVGFLRFRNPSTLNTISSCGEEAFKRTLYEQILAVHSKVPLGLNLRTSSYDDFLEDIDGIQISSGKDGTLLAMLGLSIGFVAEMMRFQWRLFYSFSGGFITSDKPVSKFENETESGLLRYFLVPLSSQWSLQFGHGTDDRITFCEAGINEVEEANLIVACCADKKILGNSKEQLTALHARRKVNRDDKR